VLTNIPFKVSSFVAVERGKSRVSIFVPSNLDLDHQVSRYFPNLNSEQHYMVPKKAYQLEFLKYDELTDASSTIRSANGFNHAQIVQVRRIA